MCTTAMLETVLVTGASGYVASHIVRAFLERGYRVKCTVRSEKSANAVKTAHPAFTDQLSFAIVPDMTAAQAFHEAAKGVVGIIHTASPFTFDVKDVENELLLPARKGTLNALEAAAANTNVRRVVLTASVACILDLSKGMRPGYTYTEEDWNPATAEEAKKSDSMAFAYCAGKALAEKAAWEWMKQEAPAFSLATLCPPWIIGPSVNREFSLNKLNESMEMVWKLVNGSTKEIPPADFLGFADSRDVAFAHLKAFELEEAGGQRFLVAMHFDYQTAIDVLRAEVPGMTKRLPEGKPGAGLLEDVYQWDGSKATRVLELQYTPLTETLRVAAGQLLEAEGKLVNGKA